MFCDIVCPLRHKDWHAAVDLPQLQHKAIWTRLHIHTHKRTSLGQSRRHISQWTVSSDSLSSLLHYLPSKSSCLPVDGHWHHVRLHFLWQNPLISRKRSHNREILVHVGKETIIQCFFNVRTHPVHWLRLWCLIQKNTVRLEGIHHKPQIKRQGVYQTATGDLVLTKPFQNLQYKPWPQVKSWRTLWTDTSVLPNIQE